MGDIWNSLGNCFWTDSSAVFCVIKESYQVDDAYFNKGLIPYYYALNP